MNPPGGWPVDRSVFFFNPRLLLMSMVVCACLFFFVPAVAVGDVGGGLCLFMSSSLL